jgi:hypothetical protein
VRYGDIEKRIFGNTYGGHMYRITWATWSNNGLKLYDPRHAELSGPQRQQLADQMRHSVGTAILTYNKMEKEFTQLRNDKSRKTYIKLGSNPLHFPQDPMNVQPIQEQIQPELPPQIQPEVVDYPDDIQPMPDDPPIPQQNVNYVPHNLEQRAGVVPPIVQINNLEVKQLMEKYFETAEGIESLKKALAGLEVKIGGHSIREYARAYYNTEKGRVKVLASERKYLAKGDNMKNHLIQKLLHNINTGRTKILLQKSIDKYDLVEVDGKWKVRGGDDPPPLLPVA